MIEFMKWPALAAILLPGLLVYLGLHIVRREIIFVDLALAQVAALGTCMAMLLDHAGFHSPPYAWSLGFTLIGAVIFTFTRDQKSHRVPQEALIGIVYVVAAAAGILLLSRSPEGDEELRHTLVGDLLLLQKPGQVWRPFCLYAAIGLVHYIFRRQFLALSFHTEALALKSRRYVRAWDFVFYALFGVVVTTFVQIGGVLLVFTYLIVPAVCANYLAARLSHLFLIGWSVAILGSLLGLYASFKLDLPTGAGIVCALGLILLFVASLKRLLPASKMEKSAAGK
jgi:zinc/manganese transport system permease protein